MKIFEIERNIQIPAIALTAGKVDRLALPREFQIYLSEPFESIELVAVIASLVQDFG